MSTQKFILFLLLFLFILPPSDLFPFLLLLPLFPLQEFEPTHVFSRPETHAAPNPCSYPPEPMPAVPSEAHLTHLMSQLRS